ncbi:MAG: glycerophosphodiester phosphodiesterase family protein [Gammaproteobacteria bacterium]
MTNPIIIAHRGASAYLPEHSRGAKALACGMGADYLEQDLIATRDGELVVLHDLILDAVSDVRERFPGRARADGRFYCIDFELAELRSLRFHERIDPATGRARYPDRYPPEVGRFGICTLAEELDFVDAVNRATGRQIGIYPEIKHPQWHRDEGIELADAVLDYLGHRGYLAPGKKIFLQCFDADTLRACRRRAGPDLPLIRLLDSSADGDAESLAEIASYADGIGPSLRLVLRGYDPDVGPASANLVAVAQRAGLAVHPYTFRADALPDGFRDFGTLIDLFLDIGVDGLFTDFIDLVRSRLG